MTALIWSRLHWEKEVTAVESTGVMMNWFCGVDAHCPVPSCGAPNTWPISCAVISVSNAALLCAIVRLAAKRWLQSASE